MGSRWEHYKGESYIVVGFAKSESDDKALVLYKPLRGPDVLPWARPLEEFLGTTEDGRARFTEVVAE